MDKLRFQSMGSGSCGNCYFIGNASYGILIDAGIGVRTIRKNLRNIGLDFENILAVLVTHDHADHIKSVGVLGEKHNIPVYATAEMHAGISKSYCVTEKLYQSKRYFEKLKPFEFASFDNDKTADGQATTQMSHPLHRSVFTTTAPLNFAIVFFCF
jgi:phosphoribosyl 1,2-cyclic phosphodiesterase